MKALTFSPAAKADLGRIWDYSAEHWGLNQADLYIDNIRDACRDLASGVRRGRSVDVRAGYLKHAAGIHMIYFRDRSNSLDVIRILHQQQDIALNLPTEVGSTRFL